MRSVCNWASCVDGSQFRYLLAATVDVDIYRVLEYSVNRKLVSLLEEEGKTLDPVGHEAWMPKETEWNSIFEGEYVSGYIAKPEYIMISKALKSPEKNRVLLLEYLAMDPPEQFFELAKKYEIKLEDFLK